MGDVLKSGLAWLTSQMATHASQSVTYARGSRTATVRATFGEKLLKLDDGDGGVRMEWTDISFVVPSVDMTLDGEAVEPKRGDRFYVRDRDADDLPTGPTRIYEVMPYEGEPVFRYTDPHRSQMRIHAKFVELEPES